jgi:hypothetical protein
MLFTLIPAGFAQSLDEIEKRDAAVVEAWQTAPLTVRHAVFVSEHPTGFGIYKERASNIFKPGEKLAVYAEPVGYGWKRLGDGLFEFGFVVDFLVKSADGEILAGKQDFARLVQRSHVRNREFMLTLDLDLTGATPGNYVVQYALHDIASDKSTSFDLPFKITK